MDICSRVNPPLSEGDKICHIMKGIEDDSFQMLLAKIPQTVTEVTTLCLS